MSTVTPVVTALYVPGDRPERFDKAVASGTDLVILDLEDSVAPEHKDRARDNVVAWLAERGGDRTTTFEVRVNHGSHADVVAVAGTDQMVGVRLPKIESAGDIDDTIGALGHPGRSVCALVESARGLLAVAEIAAHPGVDALGLGEADLASDLGSVDRTVLDWARTQLLVAARAAGKPAPMMSVYPDIGDLAGLADDTRRGRAMGFVGRSAIHPSQVAVIADAFAPSPAEVEWANEVLALTAAGGVARLSSGEMVDPAMRRRAEVIVVLARPAP